MYNQDGSIFAFGEVFGCCEKEIAMVNKLTFSD
jgi:hypothetical protein